MSDPTVRARARALDYIGAGMPNVSLGYAAEVGAREMAAPVRRLHFPLYVSAQDATGRDAVLCSACRNERGYRVDWPCDTARLIYTTEELEADRE